MGQTNLPDQIFALSPNHWNWLWSKFSLSALKDFIDKLFYKHYIHVDHTVPASFDMTYPQTPVIATLNVPIQKGPSFSGIRLTSCAPYDFINIPVTCSVQGKDLLIEHSQPLGGTVWTEGIDTWEVRIPFDAVTDANGCGMEQDYIWSFKTNVV